MFNLFSDCISCSHTHKTLRSGNTYDLHAHPEIFAHVEQTAVEAKKRRMNEMTELAQDSVLISNMVKERIRVNLEPLRAQISALTEMIDRLTQGNSTREFTTASTREPPL